MKELAGLIIRTMTRSELDTILTWACKEGWNPGLYDAEPFYRTDPAGYFACELNGEFVGGASCVRYGQEYAFLGLYIIRPELRDQGIGQALTQKLLEFRADIPTGLDGVVNMVEKYKAMGCTWAYRNARYEGTGGGVLPKTVTLLKEIPFEQLCAYDAGVFPGKRPEFLRLWTEQPDCGGYAVVEQGQIKGYTVARKCQHGYKIGPLFADAPNIAEVLFSAAAAHVGNNPLFLDPPGNNPAAIELAKRHNMTICFETARMYFGPNPEKAPEKVFGITTFELG